MITDLLKHVLTSCFTCELNMNQLKFFKLVDNLLTELSVLPWKICEKEKIQVAVTNVSIHNDFCSKRLCRGLQVYAAQNGIPKVQKHFKLLNHSESIICQFRKKYLIEVSTHVKIGHLSEVMKLSAVKSGRKLHYIGETL